MLGRSPGPRQRLIVCGGCGRTYDLDLSATMLMWHEDWNVREGWRRYASAGSKVFRKTRPAIRARRIDGSFQGIAQGIDSFSGWAKGSIPSGVGNSAHHTCRELTSRYVAAHSFGLVRVASAGPGTPAASRAFTAGETAEAYQYAAEQHGRG